MHPDQLAEANQEGFGNCISELQLCEHNKFMTGPLANRQYFQLVEKKKMF